MKRRDLLKSVVLIGAGGGMPIGTRLAYGGGPISPSSFVPADTHDLFELYHRRFAEARLRMPQRDPANPADRTEIARVLRRCLGVRDEWVPKIRASVVRQMEAEGLSIEFLEATSWPGTSATALLYRPNTSAGKRVAGPLPLVIVCCGHGKGGKLTPGYQQMARHIARRGAVVLCPDNIGQGEREPMGHSSCVKPFACGLSVQGLIVMETLAWIRWARDLPDIDRSKTAAVGNSGGGTLTVLLAALCPELAAISSSGYPSTFEFIAAKEKKHCHCNILPGIVGELEMWHLLGCFAPRPMFLFQGVWDSLFPTDLFMQAARQTRDVYRKVNAEAAFDGRLLPGEHSWDDRRILEVGKFLARHLSMAEPGSKFDPAEGLLGEDARCIESWPNAALTADALAEQLSGRRVADDMRLWDVYPPRVPSEIPMDNLTTRGETRQIFAQYEAFLARDCY